MKVTVTVRRRPEISDPQGTTVARALRDLGYDEVRKVRVDKEIRLEVEGEDAAEIEARVTEMCEKLLANPVIEDYRVELES